MHNKIVVCVGVCNRRGSTNIPQMKSLMKFGFQIIPVNYRTIIAEYGMQFFADLLLEVVKTTKPWVVIFSKCNGIPTELVKECGKYSTTYLFNMDSRPTIEKCSDVVQHAVNSHYSSCTAHEMVDWFKSEGANCHYVVQGVDPEVFKPIPKNPAYAQKMDGPVISMIGTRTTERDVYLKTLHDGGFFPTFYGPGYNREVVDREFVDICCSADYLISLNTHNGIHKGYFSNRLVRYLACGTCTFHLDEFGSLKNHFEDGKEVIFFKGPEDLIEKLHNIDDETRIRVGIGGRERVLKEYTWDHTTAKMINIIQGKI